MEEDNPDYCTVLSTFSRYHFLASVMHYSKVSDGYEPTHCELLPSRAEADTVVRLWAAERKVEVR